MLLFQHQAVLNASTKLLSAFVNAYPLAGPLCHGTGLICSRPFVFMILLYVIPLKKA